MRRRRHDRLSGEAGQVAGIEVVPFGLLVFVVGTLMVVNAWAVVDVKMAVASAARESARAYVEAAPGSNPVAAAEQAGREALAGFGRDPVRLTLSPVRAAFVRCQVVTFEARYPVPAITLPLLGGHGTAFIARARHTEVVDPFRSGVPLGRHRCDLAP